MREPSLTEIHRPEYERMIQTMISLGWAHPGWKGPEFKVRRTSKHGHVTGRGCLLQVSLQIGRGAPLEEIHEVMAHELAHAITYKETQCHGPQHRKALRTLVRAHWPRIRPWRESPHRGAQACYWEDRQIVIALGNLYGLAPAPIDEVAHA